MAAIMAIMTTKGDTSVPPCEPKLDTSPSRLGWLIRVVVTAYPRGVAYPVRGEGVYGLSIRFRAASNICVSLLAIMRRPMLRLTPPPKPAT